MRLCIHLIVITFLLAGFTINGCQPEPSGSEESEEALNQLNRSGMKHGPWEVYSDSILVAGNQTHNSNDTPGNYPSFCKG